MGREDAPPTSGSSGGKKRESGSSADVNQRQVHTNVARFHDSVRLLANKYRSILAQVREHARRERESWKERISQLFSVIGDYCIYVHTNINAKINFSLI